MNIFGREPPLYKNLLILAAAVFLVFQTASSPVYCQSSGDYSERARDASSNGNHEESVRLYTKAIELKPFDALYSLRSREYEELGKLDLALADMDKVIELKPYALYKAIERRGKLYVHMGKYDLAVADFNNVLTTNPQRFRIYEYRAEAYLIMGKPDLAYADVVKLLQSDDPEDGSVSDAIYVGYLSLRKSGKKAEAKALIDEAAPQFTPERFEAKIAFFLKGDLTAAQLLAAQPDDQSWAHFFIGEVLLLEGNKSAAAEHLRFMLDKGTKYTWEYDLAAAELNRILAAKPVK